MPHAAGRGREGKWRVWDASCRWWSGIVARLGHTIQGPSAVPWQCRCATQLNEKRPRLVMRMGVRFGLGQ